MVADPAADDPMMLVAAALFERLGVDGVYGRTELYENVIERLGRYISKLRDPAAEILSFPPVMSRTQLEKSGYLRSFPNLLGCVCALHGTEAGIRAAAEAHYSGGDWTQSVTSTDLVLTPAACYPTYPLVAARGPLPRGGLVFDVQATCFRHEPSNALSRMQSFRMREFVRIGNQAEIIRFREQWMNQAAAFAGGLGLAGQLDVANDPFFGRFAEVMALSQRQNSLKFELLIPYFPGAVPTACMSFNYHKEYFGETWNIRDADGNAAHTSCVAFGLDRLAVALFCVHGTELAKWPGGVRRTLGLDP